MSSGCEIDPEADYADTVADVRAVTEGYDGAPGQRCAPTSPTGSMRCRRLISETDRGRVEARDDEVVVRIYGEELSVLAEQAEAIEQNLSAVA